MYLYCGTFNNWKHKRHAPEAQQWAMVEHSGAFPAAAQVGGGARPTCTLQTIVRTVHRRHTAPDTWWRVGAVHTTFLVHNLTDTGQ